LLDENTKRIVVMEAVFSNQDADEGVVVCEHGSHVQGKNCKRNQWSGVRGRPGVLTGSYQFEVEVNFCLIRVGWAADISDRTLGLDALSFGYGGTGMKSSNRVFEKYGQEFHELAGAVVTCLLDRRDPKCETISYCLNGRPLGVAFQLPAELAGVPLFPAVCGKESWSAVCRFDETIAFPQTGYTRLMEAVIGSDAVSGPLVLGLVSSDGDACVSISTDGLHATSTPEAARNAWHGVRGRPGVLRGKYQFEVKLMSESLLRVGWGALRTKRALGNDAHSFGYGGTAKKSNSAKYEDYGEKYEGQIGTVLSCLIDRQEQTISFSINGRNLGIAFNIPTDCADVPLFLAICGKGAWEASCAYADLAFPEPGYRPLAEALAARDAVPGQSLSGTLAAPKGALVVTARSTQEGVLKDQLEAIAQATCIPVEGVVPGRRVVLHVNSGPWQGWYPCEVVDSDPRGCYLRHDSDGYTENVPWAFLNSGKYTMELLESSQDVELAVPVPVESTPPEGPTGQHVSHILRHGRLRVHTELGAGVTLVMCEVGYFASRIEEPGQPDLRKGDAIVAIGSTVLLGLEEDELEACFAAAFCDNAVIVLGNYLALRERPFKEVRQEALRLLDDLPLVQPKMEALGHSQSNSLQVALPFHRPAALLTRTTSTRSSDGASVLKRGRLCLDPRSGQAGLELSACQEGYYVEEIAPFPGQPDLEVGDVIVCIGGSVLHDMDPEDVEQRFGDAYCDGAVFVAGPLLKLEDVPSQAVQREISLLLTPSTQSSLLLERSRTY